MSLAKKLEARIKEINDKSKSNLDKAADEFERTLIKVLSVPGTRDNPSRPGEAPHKVTGKLVGSVQKFVNRAAGVAAIGPTIYYAAILRKTRDSYQIAIKRCRKDIAKIIFDFKGRG
ncbi:hypothetical protein TA3x_004276 [Tundrisphaera sp. TA3]|uniref:hypothetical protein n=1 Tax=Tundrisphaera sp. TA3 TaxID=3435775 RepID=UPI003EC140AD